jgi:hypothetical protein
MSYSKSVIVRRGPGFLTLLTLLFIYLRLTKAIDWHWFWVLSPILIPLIIAGIIVVAVMISAWFWSLK